MKKIIVVGAGLAGSYLAMLLQDTCEVHIYTKGSLQNSDSMLAQGGIACALDEKDSWQEHYEDTVQAGVMHNNLENVRQLVQRGPIVIKELIEQGMKFDLTSSGEYSYGLEAGHRRPRILHIQGDQTGKFMTKFVQSQLKNVVIHQFMTAVDLLKNESQVCGIRVMDNAGAINDVISDLVVLASGGVGGLYPMSSNDATITGDGLAMAVRAGVELADMEFVQFHPTMLSINGQCHGLVSEAVRGAGAILVDENDNPIMTGRHKLKDLAPRDVVARVITDEYEKNHQVFLDISAVEDFEKKFPQITANLDNNHIDFRSTKRIPVQPGAHFLMGGIRVNAEGHTNLAGLYAIGEAAFTGVHGANRLASNSLLECLVFANYAAQDIQAADVQTDTVLPADDYANHLNLPQRDELQKRAWQAIGIERTQARIVEFLDWLGGFEFEKLPRKVTKEGVELANLCLIAQKIAQAALKRQKSIGAHYWKE